MKVFTFSLLLLASAISFPARSASDASIVCTKEIFPGDMHEFSCPLKESKSKQQAIFKVELSGGHDDSMSSLFIRHGDKELPCEKGSKTVSEGEYGDITLVCQVTLEASVLAVPSKLTATLKASHTNFERYSLKLN